jgi:ferric iron reductase protein FhuF
MALYTKLSPPVDENSVHVPSLQFVASMWGYFTGRITKPNMYARVENLVQATEDVEIEQIRSVYNGKGQAAKAEYLSWIQQVVLTLEAGFITVAEAKLLLEVPA